MENPQLPPKPLTPKPVSGPKETPAGAGFTRERIVRAKETGDKIFLLKEEYVFKSGRRQWIKNPETLRALGYEFGQEQTIGKEELSRAAEGEPLDMSSSQAPQGPKSPSGAEKDGEYPKDPQPVLSPSDEAKTTPPVELPKLEPKAPIYDGEKYTVVGENSAIDHQNQ